MYRSAVEQVPIDDFTLELSESETVLRGNDITVLSFGTPLYSIETALALLASPPPSLRSVVPERVRQASVEVIDLRTVLPWDMQAIVESVSRTGRCVIVHEAGRIGGLGAELAAEIQQRSFLKLEAPVQRVTGWE